MEDEIEQLKSVFRSLVVSSPNQIDVRSLVRDYRNIIGAPVPLRKYGYTDPVEFLKERFSDCFLFSGITSNPVLTLIVPDTLKHIDKFVRSQKSSSTRKLTPKRRSVPEELVKIPKDNLITKTFKQKHTSSQPTELSNKSQANSFSHLHQPVNSHESGIRPSLHSANSDVPVKKHSLTSSESKIVSSPIVNNITCSENNRSNGYINAVHSTDTIEDTSDSDREPGDVPVDNRNAVKNFFKKRLPLYNSSQYLEEDLSAEQCSKTEQDDDSGRLTSSSGLSAKAQQLEQLKHEIMQLIEDAPPEGVWCTDLVKLYRERYNRQLNFTRFGYTSIISLVYCLEQHVQITRPVDTGDWLLQERRRAALAPPSLRPRRRAPLPLRAPRSARSPDPEDALPGIDFDPDVFPADCMHFMESIEAVGVSDLRPGAMVEVMIGEVYSPSHFWFIRLGDQYSLAMEDMMDDMTRYYRGEGAARSLARGAVRVGHYCASAYQGDWHRSLIVKIIDSDTVKVRHVDYGTVDTLSVAALRPLRREWAALPSQAARARLAAVRPPAAGWRWPHAASCAFLKLVTNRRFVANVVGVDVRDASAEVLLIDTAGADDVCVGAELVRAGHADPRPDSALRATDGYLFPRFEALESGAAPNFADVHAYLRDGISLDYVREYRDHVPGPPRSSPEGSPEPAPGAADKVSLSDVPSRITLLLPESPSASEQPQAEPLPAGAPPTPTSSLSPDAPAYVPGAPLRRAPSPRTPPPPYGPALPAPPPPPAPPQAPAVTLSVAECETYRVLSHVNPEAAHWFMLGAMGHAMGPGLYSMHPPVFGPPQPTGLFSPAQRGPYPAAPRGPYPAAPRGPYPAAPRGPYPPIPRGTYPPAPPGLFPAPPSHMFPLAPVRPPPGFRI